MTYFTPLFWGWAVIAILVPLSPIYAQTTCSINEMDLREIGIWANPKATLNELSGLEIEGSCIEGRISYRGRAFTSCSPRDCKWGWTTGHRDGHGVLHFSFGGFFKSLNMDVRPMGKRIQVYVHVESRDKNEPPRTKSYILIADD